MSRHSDLKKVARSRFKAALKEPVKVVTDAAGVLHVSSWASCEASRGLRPKVTVTRYQGGTMAGVPVVVTGTTGTNTTVSWGQTGGVSAAKDVSVRELLDSDMCVECLNTSTADAWVGAPGVAAAIALLTFEARAKKLAVVDARTSASAVQARRREAARGSRSIEGEWLARNDLEEDVRSGFEEVLTAYRKASDELRAAGRGPEAQAKVSAKIRASALPARFADQEFELDASMLLVGVSPTPRWKSDLVTAVIEAYAIRADTVSVLHAPAYVHAFLRSELCSSPRSATLVVAHPAPQSAEVRETAAGLWDPEGASALACLKRTMDSAEALSGEAQAA